jgi:hypothetical protein
MFGNDPIERIRLAVKELAAEDRREWSGGNRSDHLVELLEVAERLQAEIIRAVADWDARTDWALDAALSPRSWLAHRAPISGLAASRLVSAARLTREFEATGEALASGDVSCGHVEVLAPMVRNREPEYERNEEVLVDTAATTKVDDFADLARNWRSIADDALSKLEAGEIRERRNLHVHQSLYGMGVVNGDLDAEGTEILLTALDLACPPDPTGGPLPARSLAQRRADALVDIATASLAARSEGGRVPVGLSVIMDYGTLTGQPPADPRQARCELEGFGPIRLETAFRLACDCAVGRVVMRGDSEVLDLGRQTRLASPALRRALVARDRGCVFPGCERPAVWCDAHHINWWEHGGPTNLENCCLLCRRHHVLCHEGGWRIKRRDDGTYEAQEPTATHTQDRHRGHAPPIAA